MGTALVAGSTGLVGSSLVERLLDAGPFERVVSLVRRVAERQHPRLEERRLDFEALSDETSIRGDALFCALGTTMKRAGSEAAFRRVDHDYVLGLAAAARRGGAHQMLMVSSIGADPESGNFYLSVKGDVEAELRELGFRSLHIFRPSLLLGKRVESRPLERAAMGPARLVGPLLLGRLRPYRAMPAATLAAAMVAAAAEPEPGAHVHTYDEILALASRRSDSG